MSAWTSCAYWKKAWAIRSIAPARCSSVWWTQAGAGGSPARVFSSIRRNRELAGSQTRRGQARWQTVEWGEEFMDALSIGAVRAAEQGAQEHGITVSNAEVVADGSNLLVHLNPAPLLARVATTSALLRRPVSAWLGRDVSVAAFLHQQGMPVVPPSDLLPPGPHQYDGYTMSFCRSGEHDREAMIATAGAGPRPAQP